MTKEEFGLHYHEMRLEVEFCRRTGKAFQDFFEQIMQKADKSFLMVKPMGREGDWKADGYSLCNGSIYQCYAPEDMTGAASARKINEDFEGAREHWGEKMRSWVFVWSSERALPPQVVDALAQIRLDNKTVMVEHLGREGLWNIIKELSPLDRQSLLGTVYNRSGELIVDVVEGGYSFNVEIERQDSQGVEQMKVFCYDLTLATLWADKHSGPGFLIHDSTIFADVDERQKAHALELAAKTAEAQKFQYICCLNSDGIPSADFSEGFSLQSYVRVELTDEGEKGGLLGIRY